MKVLTASLMLSAARFVPYDMGAFVSSARGQTVTGEDLNRLDASSPDHAAMLPYWQKVSDIILGSDRMRDMHDTYLPKFPYEQTNDYEFRWKNAKFTNVYRDIVEGLASKPFEEEVSLVEGDETNKVTIPEQIEQFILDVDGAGNNLTSFAASTFFDGVNSAIDWIFVDYSKAPELPTGRARTIAEEKALNLRPFWTHVLGSNVLEVRSRIVNGTEKITFIRMQEFEPDGKYIRIMRADEAGASWELYKEVIGPKEGEYKFAFVEDGIFTIGVVPMVPFITGRRIGKHWRFHPMMRDAADLQIEVFQQESGLKNIKNLAGFPILTGNGVSPEYEGTGKNKKPKAVGAGPNAVLFGGTDGQGRPGSWEFISPEAALLTFLQADVEATIKQLRELGRQPLTAQSGNLTVITTAVAAKKGNSAVQMWALALQDALDNALRLTCLWFGIPVETYDPACMVFTDFDVDGSVDDMNILNTARKNGDLSRHTLWHEMKRRGMLSAEFDDDTEQEHLLEEMTGVEEIDPATGLPYVETPDNVTA